MKLSSIALSTAFALLVIATPTRLHGQKLEAGTWTGTSTDPMGQTQNVTFVVTTNGDSLHISLGIPDGPTLAFSDVRFEQGKLMFWVGMDESRRITCALNPADGGGYSGECTDSEGQHGQLAMIPPKKEVN
jgi:hypothetical protein